MANVKIYSTPPQLFRYRSIGGAKLAQEMHAIANSYIFCPCFSEMNDPMEGMHRESLTYIGKPRSAKERVEIEHIKGTLGIASFSEVRDHEPMWAYYADQFRGICIGYSTRALLGQLPNEVDLIRLAYNETPPLIIADRATPQDKAKLTLATKNLRWRSEREWRIIAPSRGPARYKEARAVQRVYLGSRIAAAAEEEIRQTMAELNIPVVKMKITKYKMEFSKTGK